MRTRAILAGLSAFLTFAAAAGEAVPGSKDAPMPVFVLAGQSNMDGAGQVAELPAELKGPFPDALFVRFWDAQFKPLDPAKLGKEFGPEVTFGTEMAKALKRPVGMIKLSGGGTSIEQHWNPVTFDKEKHIGELYKRLTDYVTGIQAKQKNVKIVGMIWMQGEADAKYHSKTVEQYRDKLEALIDGCRKEFGAPDMPFVCGRMNASGQYEKQVREAQATVKRKNYAWIDCDDLEKHADKLHYNSKGQLELGRRFAAAMLKLMAEEQKKAGAAGSVPGSSAGPDKRSQP
jgi:iduronate 2-sulfatase